MARIAVATYMPEMQVMTLRPEFPAFADPENLAGFTTPEQIAMFTHEWMHYLHNVSTLLGLTTFCNLTDIWTNFRWSFGPNGWSEGEELLDSATARGIEQKYQIMQVLRGRCSNSLPENAELRFANFTSAELVPSTPNIPEVALNRLKCIVKYGDPAGVDFETHEAMIGTHEILECAAFLLEERASIALETLPQPPNLDPYLLVLGVARLLAPSLDREGVLMAAIASLQNSDPPSALKTLLEFGENASKSGNDPKQAIRAVGMKMLDAYWDSAEATLQIIENFFPLDEPMGKVVKLTTSRMRANILFRRDDLFFELKIIEQLRSDLTCLDKAIRKFGAPLLIQERQAQKKEGSIDLDFCRDLMYDFTNQDPSLQAITDGWRLMHAAYRFVGAHFIKGKLQSTVNVTSRCPFYTTCNNKYREAHADHCRQRPWLSVLEGPSTCDYAFAVHITRPPAEELAQT